MKKIIALLMLSLFLSACIQTPKPPTNVPPVSLETEERYAMIDAHALNAPPHLRQNLSRLAAYLVKPARDEREKARAIFRWIAANIDYDADSYFRNGHTPNNVGDVLSSGKAVCDGYANLFKQLADKVGLETVMISGETKGYAYHTRGRLGLVGHAWNAVKIEGQWQLLDSTWGAGYLDGRNKRFVREFEPHYFLPAPSAFIFDHFPDDKHWQLLSKPVSKQAFTELAYLRPAFFKSALELVSHPHEALKTRGHLELTIRAPKENYISAVLLQNGERLPRSLVSVDRKGELYTLKPNFPQNGEYRLRIFTKRGIKAQTFDWALDYKIRKY